MVIIELCSNVIIKVIFLRKGPSGPPGSGLNDPFNTNPIFRK